MFVKKGKSFLFTLLSKIVKMNLPVVVIRKKLLFSIPSVIPEKDINVPMSYKDKNFISSFCFNSVYTAKFNPRES